MVSLLKSAGSGASSGSEAPARTDAATPRGGICPSSVEELSFVRCETVLRGDRRKRAHYFDVPVETFGAGNVTGVRAVQEFLTLLRDSKDFSMTSVEVLCDAARAEQEPSRRKSRHGAGWSFMVEVADLLQIAAKQVDWAGYIEQKCRSAEATKAWYDRKNRDAIERMLATRQAKRLQREELQTGVVSRDQAGVAS